MQENIKYVSQFLDEVKGKCQGARFLLTVREVRGISAQTGKEGQRRRILE